MSNGGSTENRRQHSQAPSLNGTKHGRLGHVLFRANRISTDAGQTHTHHQVARQMSRTHFGRGRRWTSTTTACNYHSTPRRALCSTSANYCHTRPPTMRNATSSTECRQRHGQHQYLVNWKRYLVSDSTHEHWKISKCEGSSLLLLQRTQAPFHPRLMTTCRESS